MYPYGLFKYIYAAYQAELRPIEMTQSDMVFLIRDGILKLQLNQDRFSVYKIYSEIKKSGGSIAYKNVHQRVHKILSLGLIEEVRSGGYTLHGAKYYEISLNGWLNIIVRCEEPWIKPVIKKYYNKNIIFKTFLYPYFELETIMFCLDYVDLCTYLRKCCQTTTQALKERQSYGDSVFQLSRENLDGLSGEKLREAIEQELEQQRIMEQEDRDLHLGFIEDMRTTTDGWMPMEFWSPKSIPGALDSYVKSFLFEQIAKACHFPPIEVTLSKDRKFMAAVEDMEEEFRNSYGRLMKLQNQN